MRRKPSTKATAGSFLLTLTRLGSMSVAALLLSWLMVACTASANPSPQPTGQFDTVGDDADAEGTPTTIPSREARECPNLDSQLFQLTEADDPQSLAEQLGITLQDGKVQVLLVLTGDDASFLQDFGIEPGTQSGTRLQAYVPVDQLCRLANSDSVTAVRPVAQPIQQ